MWQDPSDVESVGVTEPSGDLVSPSCRLSSRVTVESQGPRAAVAGPEQR